MLTRQQLPSVAVLVSTWLAAITLSLPWLDGRLDPEEYGGRPSLKSEAGGYWLATDGIGPVWLAVIVLVGTVALLVLGHVAAGTSLAWTGITLSGLALGMVFIVGTAVSEGLDGNPTPLAGFFLWRGALVVCAVAGVWHSFITDDLLRNGGTGEKQVS